MLLFSSLTIDLNSPGLQKEIEQCRLQLLFFHPVHRCSNELSFALPLFEQPEPRCANDWLVILPACCRCKARKAREEEGQVSPGARKSSCEESRGSQAPALLGMRIRHFAQEAV